MRKVLLCLTIAFLSSLSMLGQGGKTDAGNTPNDNSSIRTKTTDDKSASTGTDKQSERKQGAKHPTKKAAHHKKSKKTSGEMSGSADEEPGREGATPGAAQEPPPK